MANPKCSVAEFQAFFHNLPELGHVTVRGTSNIYQVQGHNALIEPAVVTVFAFHVILSIRNIANASIRESVRCKEGTATHASVHISVLQFFHNFSGNVVRNHTFRSTFGGQLRQIVVLAVFMNIVLIQYVDELRERWGDVHTIFVLYAENTLFKHCLNTKRKVISQTTFRHFVKVHVHCDKRCLTVGGHESDDLVLNRLNTGFNFLIKPFFSNFHYPFFSYFNTCIRQFLSDSVDMLLSGNIDERCKMSQCNRLTTVLVGSDLGDNLSCNIAGRRKAVRFIDACLTNDGTVLEHVLQVD